MIFSLKTKFCILLFGCFIFSALHLNAQVVCGMPEPSEAEKKQLLTLYENQLRLAASSRSINETYNIPVQATIVHPQNEQTPVFTENHVREIISSLNVYFKPINIEFFLLEGTVNHLSNSPYANLKAADEQSLISQLAVKNAINLYFVQSYTDYNLSILNGSATLPNLSNSSNRIFISYFENNGTQFQNLRDKIVPHEFGHFFGLLHTFQDSNNASIAKRELVTRDLSKTANCYKTGDQLCDTNADPFELYPSILQFGCNAQLPSMMVDAEGNLFVPPVNNIMSYQLGCGNLFTPQQYQKMQASFAIRFAPNAEYTLISKVPNFISIGTFDQKEYCVGATVKANFKKQGVYETSNQYILELSDGNGQNFTELGATFTEESVSFKLPLTLAQSSNYRIRITSLRPYVESYASEAFTVKNLGALQLTATQTQIRQGESVGIITNFSGTPPFYAQISSGLEVSNLATYYHSFTVSPTQTTTYEIFSASSACGMIYDKKNVTVQVVASNMRINEGFSTNLCQNDFIILPVSGIKNYSGTNPYKVVIYNQQKRFEVTPQVGLSSFFFLLPSDLSPNETYQLYIDSNQKTDFSNEIKISIKPIPKQPSVVSPIRLCFNTTAQNLQAQGANLRWYYGENTITSYNSIRPTTSQAGTSEYFVSQVNEFGCESKRSQIQVFIQQPVTANIAGNETINLGETARVSVTLTGEAPWKIELSDGFTVESNTETVIREVQPEKTIEYTLKKVENSCGSGFVSGVAKVIVIPPLANESSLELTDNISLYPNPVVEKVFLKSTFNQPLHNATIFVQSLDGKNITSFTQKLWLPLETIQITLPSLAEGTYILLVQHKDGRHSLKFVK